MSTRSVLWLVTAALAAVTIVTDVPSLVRGPAPYPPEWQWLRREEPTSRAFAPAGLAAAALVSLALFTASRAARRDPAEAARLALAGAGALGFLFSLGLLALEPQGAFETVFGRVVYRTATSYHTVAVSPLADDPLAFVREHDRLLPQLRKAAKHAATHPPGPVLYFRALLALCTRAPGPARELLELAGLGDERSPKPSQPSRVPARAAAFLGGLGMLLAAALTVWPVASLARHLGSGPLAAARVAVLWAALPGPALMAPQIDQAIALPMALAAAGLLGAVLAPTPRRAGSAAVLAGLAGGVAAGLTYGAPAFMAIAGCAAAGAASARGVPWVTWARTLALAALSMIAAFLLPMLIGHRPLDSALAALAIHRDVYTRPRDYGVWLVFDVVDLAVFLGAPVACVFAARCWRAVRSVARGARPEAGPAYAGGAAVGLLLLLLSGTTRGEVGRLWIPLMPVLLAGAVAGPDSESGSGPTAGDMALATGLLCGLALLLRVFWMVP